MSATTMHRRRYQATDPTRRLVGWAVVIAIHVLVLWAVVSGTARRGLELIKKPLEAAVIQEVIIPPPPPPPPPSKEIKRPEQKVVKAEAPPPPYVPPPEVQPPVSSSAVAVQSVATPPIAPPVIAPPPPPAPPPPKPAATGRAEMGVACPEQVKPEMPRKALQEGTEGVVRAQALIRDGTVREVTILSGPRIYHSAVRNAMLQYKCVSGPGDVIATQEFVFKIDQ